jgi:hypothetical protein
MTEVLFYHLEHQPLERVLPSLVERTLERGWRAVVQAGSEERVEAWTRCCGPIGRRASCRTARVATATAPNSRST